MSKGKRDGLLIAGGGLAGSLAAIAMARLRPEVPLLLVEGSDGFGGGDHVWTFFDSELGEDDQWLFEHLSADTAPGFYAAFPGQSRNIKAESRIAWSRELDRAVRDVLRPDQYRLNTKIVAVRENELVLPGGERIRADGAIDARGPANLAMLDLGWRKYLAREYRFAEPHRVDRPVLIDATVEQSEDFRFVYCLPFSQDRMLVAESYYSNDPQVDLSKAGARLEAYLRKRGWRPERLVREEVAARPLPYGGDLEAFWRVGGARVAKLGLRGGFFNPVTGTGFAEAVRTATLLAGQRDYGGEALHHLFEEEAASLWRKREFYYQYNALMFESPVWERFKVIEALHMLEPGLIAGFHAGTLNALDKRRVLASLQAAAKTTVR